MKKRQYLLIVVLTIVSGLVGGAVSNRLFVAKTVVAQGVPTDKEIVLAKGFILADDKGNVRATWGVTAEDEAEISFFDRNGELRASLDEVSIGFLDKNRKPRVGLNEAGICFFDKNGKVRALMTANSEGSSKLILSDKHGAIRATLGTDPTLGTGLVLCDKNRKARIATGVDDSDAVLFELRNKDGKVIWSAP